jgi:glycosyltransferase involved in cell wall biosynthesis
MKLSVVIPCYNERSTIEAVVEAVRSAPVEEVEIIVVDDGSTDGTRELLKGKPPGWVDKIVLQEGNCGKCRATLQFLPPDLLRGCRLPQFPNKVFCRTHRFDRE